MNKPTLSGTPPTLWNSEQVDLTTYGRRIGLPDGWPGGVDEHVLRTIHRAHVSTIPYDNLDFLTDVPVAIDPAAVTAKLCGRPRGGCCHEHNLLLGCVLERLGFQVDRLAARVLLGGKGARPRTHMALRVRHGHKEWLCDVGFGVHGFLDPLKLSDGAASEQGVGCFRVRALQEPFWAVEAKLDNSWAALYQFTLEPQHPIDFVVAHHFLATHPGSMLRQLPLLQLVTPDRQVRMHGYDIAETHAGVRRTRTLTQATLATELAVFGIRLPSQQLRELGRRLFPGTGE
ncbi:arylamine N-acetyltransferase [Streptomyces sp. NPDC052077]|uniref:arylamine N-acetyltransferase family protein n=1 Tax=Streptomyces sp. NPDC052077 TaxID=3154757 RepID=UPI003449BA20